MSESRFKIQIDGVEHIIKSVSEANKKIKELVKEIVTLKSAGEDATVAMQSLSQVLDIKHELQNLSRRFSEASANISRSQAASSNAAQALLNLNYVIRDSPYLFQNFALGVLSVGNNLNPLIDSFSRLKVEAGERGVSAVQLLRNALVGGAGISIAFSVVVTAIQAVVFWMQKNRSETDKTTESIEKQRSALEKLTRVQLMQRMAAIRKAISEGIMTEEGALLPPDRQDPKVHDLFKELKLLEQIEYELGDIEDVKNRLLINEKKFDDLSKKNFATLVEGAKSYEDARSKLAEWIKADKEFIAAKQKLLQLETGRKDEIEKGIIPALEKELEIHEKIFRQLEANQVAERKYHKEAIDNIKTKIEFYKNAWDSMVLSEEAVEESVKEWQRNIEKEAKKGKGFPIVPKKEEVEKPPIFSDEEWGTLTERVNFVRSAVEALGDSLFMAFMRGKNVLQEFIVSLGIALARMLLMQALFKFFNFASMFGGGSDFGPVIASSASGAQANKVTVIGGKLSADYRELVIRLEQEKSRIDNSLI